MTLLTISEAARLCGINRRTLQRAIQSGRLTLTADHRVETAELRRAGYAVSVPHLDAALLSHMDTAHDTAPTPQEDAALLSQAIRDLTAALEAILEAVNAIRGHVLSPVDTAGTPHHVAPQPQDAPQVMPQDAAPMPHHDALTPQEAPQAVAETPQGIPQGDTAPVPHHDALTPQAVTEAPEITPQEEATAERAPGPLLPHVLAIAEIAAQYDKLSLAELSQLLYDRHIYRAKDRKAGDEKPVNRGTLGRWLEQARQAGVL